MQKHLYHLVDRSPWPLTVAIGLLITMLGFICYMNRILNGFILFIIGVVIILLSLYVWWRDIIRESSYQGNHTIIVQKGLKIGFILFSGSEIMFFAGFFWAFFHSSLSPAIILGMIWPPINIVILNAWSVPLFNTTILLVSGVSITWTHFCLIKGDSIGANDGFVNTLFLAFFFTLMQIIEYFNATFNISDSVYGSCFFALTGLHGLHVIIGSIFIFICFFRLNYLQFTKNHHLGFEFASWYWHFVDVVWLFSYVFVYIWGGL